MMKMRIARRPVAVCVALSALMATNALAWESFTVFGDSLSDGGNVGRFTWDGAQHPLYDELLATREGLTLRPSSQGGSNYAEGGAVTRPPLNPLFNTADQLAAYLNATGGRADSNGLYLHWAGANDVAAAAQAPLTAVSTLSASAAAATAQVKALLAAGAGAVIVPTVPPLGETPLIMQTVLSALGPASEVAMAAAFQSLDGVATPNEAARQQAARNAFAAAAAQVTPVAAQRAALTEQLYRAWQTLSGQVSALTAGYNQQEEAGLATLSGNIVRADVAGLFSEVIADPARYGLSNTLGTACPVGTSAAVCASTTPGFSSQQAWLFADRLHPSPAVHAMIADYIASILAAPAQVAALAQATQGVAEDMQQTLSGHLQQQRRQPAPAGEAVVFGGYAGQHIDNRGDAWQSGDATSASVTLGVGYQLTDSWQSGVIYARTSQRQQPSSRFDYRLRGDLVALYSQLQLGGQGWINGDLHYADLDFDDIQREVKIGPASRTEQGNSGGKLLGMRVQAGWDIPLSAHLTTGPVVSYALDYGRVGGYREQGDSSTAMRYGDQTRHTQIGAIGWRIDTQQWRVNPWAEVSYRHRFDDDDARVTAGLSSTRTAFSRQSDEGDRNWLDIAAGASLPLGERINAFAGVAATGGDSDARQLSWNLGLNARF